MAGFNYEAGRSNNMVAAEDEGKLTAGRWGKRYGVSAAAVVAVMKPTEAHHTGTGRRGKSRLTSVLSGDLRPTDEQLAAMRAFDAGDRVKTKGAWLRWEAEYSGSFGRKRWVPTVGVYEGDEVPARKLKDFESLADADFAFAQGWQGRDFREFRKALARFRTGSGENTAATTAVGSVTPAPAPELAKETKP